MVARLIFSFAIEKFVCYKKSEVARLIFSIAIEKIARFKFIFAIEKTNLPENCNLILFSTFLFCCFNFIDFLFCFVFSRKNILFTIKKLKRCKLFYFQPRRGLFMPFHSNG